MIVTNSIIKVVGDFNSKEEIKKYLYTFIEDHPFRKYNQQIADEYGEDLFSMTFVPRDTVVLTQRYPTQRYYIKSVPFRDDIIQQLLDWKVVAYYKTSKPIVV